MHAHVVYAYAALIFARARELELERIDLNAQAHRVSHAYEQCGMHMYIVKHNLKPHSYVGCVIYS